MKHEDPSYKMVVNQPSFNPKGKDFLVIPFKTKEAAIRTLHTRFKYGDVHWAGVFCPNNNLIYRDFTMGCN